MVPTNDSDNLPAVSIVGPLLASICIDVIQGGRIQDMPTVYVQRELWNAEEKGFRLVLAPDGQSQIVSLVKGFQFDNRLIKLLFVYPCKGHLEELAR